MKKPPSSFDWNEEYRLFLESPKSPAPTKFSTEIKGRVALEFNPAAWLVFSKLFAIHFIASVLSLLVCPQFHVGLFGAGKGLFRVFEALGEYGCMLACGAFFLGATGLLSAFLLSVGEIRAIKKSRGLQWALLAFLSVGFFLAFKEQEISIPLSLAGTWVVGAILGGTFSFKISSFLRAKVRQHLALP